MLAPGRWSKRTRKVMQGSVLIPSYGRSSRFGHEVDHLIAPPTDSNAKMTSVCAGHRLGGASRRNRTGDPILTMEPPGTAVRTAVSPGRVRRSGPKLSVLFRLSYAFSSRALRRTSLSKPYSSEIKSPASVLGRVVLAVGG